MYTVPYSAPPALCQGTAELSCDFTGLMDGVHYVFNVYAFNVVGAGPGGTSNAVTPISEIPSVTSLSPSSGSPDGGATVTISGANLKSASSVDFGSNPAMILSRSSTTLTVVSPAGIGRVDVTVTNSFGTSSTLVDDEYSYTVPTIESVSPNVGSSVGGEVLYVYGTGFKGATGVLFGAIPATAIQVIGDSEVAAVVPPGLGAAVNLTVMTPNGTSQVNYADVFTPVTTTDYVPCTGTMPVDGEITAGTYVVNCDLLVTVGNHSPSILGSS